MNEPLAEPIVHRPWYCRELTMFIGGSIVISFVLLAISTAL